MNGMKIEGRVKFFNQEKGFGFIKSGADEIFVHATDLTVRGTKLDQGDEVLYRVGQGNKGPKAIEVDLVRKADLQSQQQRPQRRERRERDDNARF